MNGTHHDALSVLRHPDQTLWVVTAADGPRRGGLIATFVVSASIVPELPRVLLGIARHHHTWKLIQASGMFALHLIDESQLDLVWRFGLQTGLDADKLAGLRWRTEATGSPILEESVGWLDCRVEGRLDTGDRTVHLSEIVAGRLERNEPPLTMKRLLQLAPPDRLAVMREQLAADASLDATAIQAWRE